MIKVENLTKKYGNNIAVDDVTITIPDGAIYAIVGPNGAGKSTFLKILCRIIDYDAGTISFNENFSVKEYRETIGYLPEQRGLYGGIDIATQLRYFAAIRGVSSKVSRQNIDFWLRKFEIGGWKYRKTNELSKGMQQKVQIVSCLISMPKLIFMDEPFSGIDPINFKLFTEIIKEYQKDSGATIVLSTHNMKSVDEICSSVAFMKDGKMNVVGNTADVRKMFINEKSFEVVLLNDKKIDARGRSWLTAFGDSYTVDSVDIDGEYVKLKVSVVGEITTGNAISRLMDKLSQYNVVSCGINRPSMEEIFLQIS